MARGVHLSIYTTSKKTSIEVGVEAWKGSDTIRDDLFLLLTGLAQNIISILVGIRMGNSDDPTEGHEPIQHESNIGKTVDDMLRRLAEEQGE